MFTPEIACSLTVSNRLGRISFINLDYCLLLKNASDWLELSIGVYILICMLAQVYVLLLTRLHILSIHLINALNFTVICVTK